MNECDKNENAMIPKSPVWLATLLVIVTVGIYIPVWFMRRREWLNRLSRDNNIDNLALRRLLVCVCLEVVCFLLGCTVRDVTLAFVCFLVERIFYLIATIMSLVFAFRVRDILLRYCGGRLSEPRGWSGFLTFVVTIIYLQYEINRMGQPSSMESDVA